MPIIDGLRIAVTSTKRIDLLVNETTVSVHEGTGKSVFIGREN